MESQTLLTCTSRVSTEKIFWAYTLLFTNNGQQNLPKSKFLSHMRDWVVILLPLTTLAHRVQIGGPREAAPAKKQ